MVVISAMCRQTSFPHLDIVSHLNHPANSESVSMKNVLFNILSQLCLIQFQLSELRFKEKIIKNCPEMSLFVLKFVKHIMIAGVHVKLNVQLLSKHF